MSVLKTFAYVSGMSFEDFCFKPKKYIYKYIAKNFDWSRSNQELAEEAKHTCVDIQHFRSKLRKMGFSIPRSKKQYKAVSKWADKFKAAGLGKITDVAIAEKFNVSREYVRQIRNKCGIKLNVTARADAIRKNNRERNEKRWTREKKEFRYLVSAGVGKCRIKKFLRIGESGLKFLQKICGVRVEPILTKWANLVDKIDWNSSNVVIGKKLGIKPISVSIQRSRLRNMGYNIPRLTPFGREARCTAQAI